jgi:polyphenol oxidase
MKEYPSHVSDLFNTPKITSFISKRNSSFSDVKKLTNTDHLESIEMNQTHSNQVKEITNKEKNSINEDAIFTCEKNILLTVRTADCLPILIAHPNPLIAVIHAGRVGTDNNITYNTLDSIQRKYDLKENFDIYFGPHICKNCYEINPKTKTHYDLSTENISQIKDVLGTSFTIQHNPYCTSCNNDLFFSYRKEGKKAGRFYSSLAI